MSPLGFPHAIRTAFAAVALAMLALTGASADQRAESSLTVLRLAAPGNVVVAGQVLDKEALRVFYSRRQYALAWNASVVGLGARASTVFTVLSNADCEGLEPADYHIREISGLANATSIVDDIDRDLLLTDGLIRYATDVAGGKLGARQTDERFLDRQSMGLPEYLAAASSLPPADLRQFLD
ncbi:MAG TPA: hypothetical protein VL899_14235, partial [Alphaproteobacteria bacterium]|nr:hypothetical protein [Alphaproteobacteria bacterium]